MKTLLTQEDYKDLTLVQPCASLSECPCLSILVRMKNEIKALPDFWDRLQRQTIFSKLEIFFLDSGSTDGSIEFLLGKPCGIVSLNGQFNFGESCNQLIAISHAPFLCFLSAHVLLLESYALEKAVELLQHYPRSALYFRQVPNGILGWNYYEAAYLKHRFPPGDAAEEKMKPDSFSNAASMLTREACRQLPFRPVHGSEDFVWAREHLDTGGKLFYMPHLSVMHSHNESAAHVYERVRLNVEVRGERGQRWRAFMLFAGVYLSMRRIGASHAEAIQYARSHSRAYW